ncbi:TetR/AcrR family transcriptional regulator [Actinoplanes bogorensis]|uniref:TetR/AcrR family transcriptional regulator n=1 Tax=Paractinoplanes bogorensis TaxID=1610840 RepID=A0ABS5YPA7_9ACTN|nr:TetR family transcriptional regulator [Actinoplanes bogorensis]MBU2665291.1 TetR/AcrR family transcriptional regulator [Actinoplanes bogorensis]
MSTESRPRRIRADAERSTARILEAALVVLAADPAAPMERIADAAGLARATVHRRFPTRRALLEALAAQLNDRYLLGLKQARVETAPPVVALYRLAETVFELKISHRFAIEQSSDRERARPLLTAEVVAGLDLLFTRLHAEGAITAAGPAWCRQVFLALLQEVDQLPADAPELGGAEPDAVLGARVELLVASVLGALGGRPAS